MTKFGFFNIFLLMASAVVVSSCKDDEILPDEPIVETNYSDPTIPEDMKEGFTLTFNMRLDPIGSVNGIGTRTTSEDIYDIDNYIDLEKVRILFFICAKRTTGFDTSGLPTEVITEEGKISGNPGDADKNYYIGDQDYFLFESKSRWVSQLSGAESSSANWQVTAPVFTYGNNELYDWDKIREALQTYPFKVVILVNRPDNVDFGNFDNKFGDQIVHFTTDRGPNWGPEDSWIVKKENAPIINDLHHCQWDAVYASKNNGDKNTYSGAGVYTMIMKNPDTDKIQGQLTAPSDNPNVYDPISDTNLMGALSYWTTKKKNPDGSGNIKETAPGRTGNDANFYFHPDKVKQGIPMYGVQIFNPITNWTKGTPFNLSYGASGQDAAYERKNIHLLRSLVKLELKVPKTVTIEENGVSKDKEIKVINPHLQFSNVMARCEPLDVATPPEILWKSEADCEWENIYAYGPIINGKVAGPNLEYFQERTAWFYGAWKGWWDYNKDFDNGLKNGSRSTLFDKNGRVTGKPYPRIFNPVIQRNQDAMLDDCLVEDDAYWYYVVYTGERNINDSSYFGTDTAYDYDNSMISFFFFQIEGDDSSLFYKVALTDYEHNSYIKNTNYYEKTGIYLDKYKKVMAPDGTKENWNWPLLRNHCYTFIVNSFGNFSDPGGLDVTVVSTEKRTAPDFFFN